MNVLDLFSGIGGFSLGLERAGMQTIAFCEFDTKAQLVLKKHWPEVPIFKDIKELTYDGFMAESIGINGRSRPYDGDSPNQGGENSGGGPEGLQSEDGQACSNNFKQGGINEITKIDLVCGGFPCQPWSTAGKRGGNTDDRDLWPEMLRIIKEFKPKWVIGENVEGFTHHEVGLGRTISDLEKEGYETRVFNIPACAVQAWHQRKRIWIVAHSKGQRTLREPIELRQEDGGQRGALSRELIQPSDVADSDPESHVQEIGEEQRERPLGLCSGAREWPVEPSVGRVANGVPNRVDRLKQLGNGVVPQVVEMIGRAIMEAERGK